MSITSVAPSFTVKTGRVDPKTAKVNGRTGPRRRLHRPVFGEELFRDALVRERKRADRFGYPFLVLLVDGGSLLDRDGWTSVLRALAAAKRGIDVVGWLERGTVLGLLVPETAAAEKALQLKDRVVRELAKQLSGYPLARLSVRLYAHGGPPCPDSHRVWPADPLLEAFGDRDRRWWRDAAKRGLDLIGGLMLLASAAPLLAVIAAAVKWTSPGPALFRQTRIGRRGEPFTMLKFRTMHLNAGEGFHKDYVTWFITSSGTQSNGAGQVFKLTNDPRVTRVGHVLRKTSLDELPQFWNVLRGDMSLVGPRPPLPYELERYQPWHRRRVLEVKPGITGLWQVSGRSRTTFDDMVRLDLRYARTWSLWTDIKILAATPWAVISGKGAA